MLTDLLTCGLFDMKLLAVEISMWTPTTRSKIPGSCSAMRDPRVQSVTKSIKRYGHFILPMDECLGRVPSICAEDRIYPLMMYLPYRNAGIWTPGMVREFSMLFHAAAMNLHIKVLTPGNNHHMMEAMFKAFAKALDMAVECG